ncbi:hypothetical protein CQW23_28124 [Capsicum baccatum]|uniref:Uncharacterized protein n=1 Tax=Capsicum baccatum TaxID=33114 RepID=A0A2G2VFQ6_CAPBA|nr:hypothetical protein CQW23_28124 [Capsicum baccatum]
MYAELFSLFAWRFFDVDPDIDIDIDKPRWYWLDIQRYLGEFNVENNVTAILESLRLRVARCLEGKPNAQKLIEESDDVILVQYVNGPLAPNETTMYKL